jgi:hypothetical protein
LAEAKRNGKGIQKGDILEDCQDLVMDGPLSASQGASEGLLTEDGKNKAKVRQSDDTLFSCA